VRCLSRLANVIIFVVALAGSAELFSYVFLVHAIESGPYGDRTQAVGIRHKNMLSGAWLNEHAPWGAWHVPGADLRHERTCFSVHLRANSYGARDVERPRGAEDGVHRVVVLGDSFAEGFGVEEHERLTNLLEQKLGIAFLNFGTSLDAGPLSYQILYDQLASHFAHDEVLIMFFSDNDLTDHDMQYWQERRPQQYALRYRPYYQSRVDGGYAVHYPVPPPSQQVLRDTSFDPDRETEPAVRHLDSSRAWLSHNSWSYRALLYALALARGDFSRGGYQEYSEERLHPVLWSFKQIKSRAGARRVTIVMIPRLNDLQNFPRGYMPELSQRMRAFADAEGFVLIDLLDPMRAAHSNPAMMFLPCDGHWSALGHEVAAGILEANWAHMRQ
jgi:hypothetical protein